MWLFVFFDIPVKTTPEARNKRLFKKALEGDGFSMLQSSVYIRHCANIENTEAHINLIKKEMPPTSHLSILYVNDDEYDTIQHLWGADRKPTGKPPKQLELF